MEAFTQSGLIKGMMTANTKPPIRLMIVDDNESIRRIIKSIVSDLVEELYECEDGRQALALYAEHRPDWVLMDIRMKEMDGLDATSHIVAAFPDARIVIVTDHDDSELRDAARRAGACRYLNKRNLLDIRLLLSTGSTDPDSPPKGSWLSGHT